MQDASDIGGIELLTRNATPTGETARIGIPTEGRRWSEIRSELLTRKSNDFDWRSGKVPLYVYHDDDELLAVSREAYCLYFSENALGGRAFPSLQRMESEIVRMALSLFRAPQSASGSFTSGGTESLFLALKTARDHFRARRASKVRPKVVVPVTAHPAFDKAAQYLDIDVVRIDVGADLRVNIDGVRRAIDSRTILIAGSAPCYPYGVFDSIAQLGEIANGEGVWLHVDACFGGFLAPFARAEGYPIPEFEFSVPGVTSLSADLHKYGFSARGASVLLYAKADLKAHQGFRFDDWPRGSYSTDTFLGSRSGGAIASAWAVTQYLGQTGYRRLARKIMDAKERLVRGIGDIPGLEVLKPSDLCIVLYRSTDQRVDINAVAEVLGTRGWFVGRSREPQALHLALNAVHAPIIEEYLSDLRCAVQHVRATGLQGKRDDSTY